MSYNKYTSIEPKEIEVIGQCEECGSDIYEVQGHLVSKEMGYMYCSDMCFKQYAIQYFNIEEK